VLPPVVELPPVPPPVVELPPVPVLPPLPALAEPPVPPSWLDDDAQPNDNRQAATVQATDAAFLR
jgi:hypothetical protein